MSGYRLFWHRLPWLFLFLMVSGCRVFPIPPPTPTAAIPLADLLVQANVYPDGWHIDTMFDDYADSDAPWGVRRNLVRLFQYKDSFTTRSMHKIYEYATPQAAANGRRDIAQSSITRFYVDVAPAAEWFTEPPHHLQATTVLCMQVDQFKQKLPFPSCSGLTQMGIYVSVVDVEIRDPSMSLAAYYALLEQVEAKLQLLATP